LIHKRLDALEQKVSAVIVNSIAAGISKAQLGQISVKSLLAVGFIVRLQGTGDRQPKPQPYERKRIAGA
jgi:hypothetical protein